MSYKIILAFIILSITHLVSISIWIFYVVFSTITQNNLINIGLNARQLEFISTSKIIRYSFHVILNYTGNDFVTYKLITTLSKCYKDLYDVDNISY